MMMLLAPRAARNSLEASWAKQAVTLASQSGDQGSFVVPLA
jgi:hypothetical protein